MSEIDRDDEAPGAPEPPSADHEVSSESPEEQVTYETGGPRLAALIGLFALVGLWVGWQYVAIILGIIAVIFLHELGHFLTAKWSGMKVTEFFIGFGPKIWSFHRGEVEYGLKVIPAGAYVRIVGMNNLDPVDPADEPRTYRQQSFPKRLLVVSAGSLMHFVQAWIILFLLLAVVGLPGGSFFATADAAEDWVVSDVTDDSAAAAAGIEPGDRIVAFDGQRVDTFVELTDEIRRSDVREEVRLVIERDGERFPVDAELGARPTDVAGPRGSPFLGVGQTVETRTVGPLRAVERASTETLKATREAGEALVGIFSPGGLSNLADDVGDGRTSSGGSGSESSDGETSNRPISIIGVVRLGAQLTEEGAAQVLGLFLALNIFIGILNMVPLLPFDGGHAAVAIYERLRSRPRRGERYHADIAKLLPVAYTVVMGLALLFVTTLYLDIINPIEL
jgi:membrane-associated protease RseP (regulator of RpoE activity)